MIPRVAYLISPGLFDPRSRTGTVDVLAIRYQFTHRKQSQTRSIHLSSNHCIGICFKVLRSHEHVKLHFEVKKNACKLTAVTDDINCISSFVVVRPLPSSILCCISVSCLSWCQCVLSTPLHACAVDALVKTCASPAAGAIDTLRQLTAILQVCERDVLSALIKCTDNHSTIARISCERDVLSALIKCTDLYSTTARISCVPARC